MCAFGLHPGQRVSVSVWIKLSLVFFFFRNQIWLADSCDIPTKFCWNSVMNYDPMASTRFHSNIDFRCALVWVPGDTRSSSSIDSIDDDDVATVDIYKRRRRRGKKKHRKYENFHRYRILLLVTTCRMCRHIQLWIYCRICCAANLVWVRFFYFFVVVVVATFLAFDWYRVNLHNRKNTNCLDANKKKWQKFTETNPWWIRYGFRALTAWR